MSRRPVWSERALKDAERLDARTRERVLAAVERLATTDQGDVRRLRDREGEWRLRVGDWRILFRYSDEPDPATVFILRVLPRGRAYR